MVRPTSLSSSEPSSPIPSHTIDQLDKTDAPPIPEVYVYLGVQCLIALCVGLEGYAIPLYGTLAVQKLPTRSPEPVRAPYPLDPLSLPESEPSPVGLQTVCAMLNAD